MGRRPDTCLHGTHNELPGAQVEGCPWKVIGGLGRDHRTTSGHASAFSVLEQGRLSPAVTGYLCCYPLLFYSSGPRPKCQPRFSRAGSHWAAPAPAPPPLRPGASPRCALARGCSSLSTSRLSLFFNSVRWQFSSYIFIEWKGARPPFKLT